MSKRMLIAYFSALAAAIAMNADEAGATTYSDEGWVQLQLSSSNSASTQIGDYDFSIGYAAQFGIGGYNWDVAPNTVSVSCVSYLVDMGLATFTVAESVCPTLPGTKLSTTTASTSTTLGGFPAIRKTKTIVWDVPDAGATAQVDGSFRVPATLFDQDFDLLKLTASASGNSLADDTVSADLFVVGAKVFGGSAALPASQRIAEKCMTLFDIDASFTIVGIPVTVGAAANGCLFVDANASWSFKTRTLGGTVTPGANVDAEFSAGIGADLGFVSASAGVYGNLTVVDASLPVSLSAAIGASGITIGESARLTMTGLDGDVGLYAEACLLGGCKDGTLEIFDWTGLTYLDATIFSASQTIPY